MGSSGTTRKLIALPGGRTATGKGIQSTILKTLLDVWYEILPYSWRHTACGWINLGEDSLLTIEAEGGASPGVTFWFYESVAWPQGIADHWLDLALAVRRRDFELALGRIGVGLDSEDWPEPIEFFRSRGKGFFEHEGAIGRVFSDCVEWEMKEYGKEFEVPSTPLDELEPELRMKVEATQSATRCICPACTQIFEQRIVGPFEGVNSAPPELLRIFEGYNIFHVCRAAGAWFVSPHSRAHEAWTLRSSDISKQGVTVDALSDRKRHVNFIHEFEGSLIAQIGSDSGPRYVSKSEDGGATWSTPVPTPGMPKLKYPKFALGDAPGVIFAAGSPAKELYRSTDGGASFEVFAKNPTCSGKPIRSLSALCVRGNELFALIRISARDTRLARSKDSGATFELIDIRELGAVSGILCPPSEPGVLGVTGYGKYARSEDGGATWSLHPIAAGAVHATTAGPKSMLVALDQAAAGIYESTDGGRSWSHLIKVPPQSLGYFRLFSDPTGESRGLFSVGTALYSIPAPH